MSIVRKGRAARVLLSAAIVIGTLAAAAACSDSTTTEVRRATAMTVFAGNFQTGEVAKPIPQPLSVEVRDQHGKLLNSVIVEFESSGNGTFTQREALSDTMGIASTYFTLGTVMGAYTVTASVNGIATPAIFTFQARPGQAMQLAKIDGDGQTAGMGERLAEPLVVKCVDLFGNPVAGLSVTWTVVGGGTVSDNDTVTDDNGEARVMFTLGGTPGSQNVVAHVQNLADVQFVAVAHQ